MAYTRLDPDPLSVLFRPFQFDSPVVATSLLYSISAPAAECTPTAGEGKASTGKLNMDDANGTIRQAYARKCPETTQEASREEKARENKVIVNMHPCTVSVSTLESPLRRNRKEQCIRLT